MIELTFNADIEFHDEQHFDVIFEEDSKFELKWTYADASSKDEYMGSYEVTPSTEEQTLSTTDKVLTRDVVIKPIPNNYGLITWDGTKITVS